MKIRSLRILIIIVLILPTTSKGEEEKSFPWIGAETIFLSISALTAQEPKKTGRYLQYVAFLPIGAHATKKYNANTLYMITSLSLYAWGTWLKTQENEETSTIIKRQMIAFNILAIQMYKEFKEKNNFDAKIAFQNDSVNLLFSYSF